MKVMVREGHDYWAILVFSIKRPIVRPKLIMHLL